VLAPVAKEAGFEITYEDMEKLAKEASEDELSEDELSTAAGGGGFCKFGYGIGWGKHLVKGGWWNECYIAGMGGDGKW
jgi:hypothetical protein